MLWHRGTRSYLVWIALRAQGQVNCSDGVPRTNRSWKVWIAGTHTGKFYTSNPVSLGPVSPGQAGSGPGFQKLFSALMGGSLASWGELSSQGSPLLATMIVWSLRMTALGVPPKVDLLIQSSTFLCQALGTGSLRVPDYIIKWKGH